MAQVRTQLFDIFEVLKENSAAAFCAYAAVSLKLFRRQKLLLFDRKFETKQLRFLTPAVILPNRL